MYADKNEWLLTVGENQVKDGHLVGWSISKLLDIDIKSLVAPNGNHVWLLTIIHFLLRISVANFKHHIMKG